jgi:thioredoxin reductase
MTKGDLMGTEKIDLAIIGGGAVGTVASVTAGVIKYRSRRILYIQESL